MLTDQLEEDAVTIDTPHIAGSFNSWKLEKMYTLQEACKILDKSKSIEVPEALSKPEYKRTKKEQKMVEMYYEQIDSKYRKFWYQIFEENLLYKPFYENYPYQYSANEDVYVFFDYLKPMKYDYVVVETEGNKKKFYSNSMVALTREEEIRVVSKEYNRSIVQREFKKENSVFAPWKADNTKEILTGFSKDISRWKVQRFVKDEEDYNNVWKILEQNVLYLKTMYIILISNSNFPSITWNDFTTFVNNWKLIDENLQLSTVDRLFIATKSGNSTDLKDFPERDLARFEFYEIIVRMAGAKYKDWGKWENYAHSVRTIIEEDFIQFFNISKWQDFREKELWTLEVNDVLNANIEALKKIYKQFESTKKSYMELNDTLNLVTRNSGLISIEKDVISWFAMSKSTIPNEFTKRKDYNNLSFVEFLEFIWRAADIRGRVLKSKLKTEDKTDISTIQDPVSIDPVSIDPDSIEIVRSETRNIDKQADNTNTKLNSSFIQDRRPLVEKIEWFLDDLLPIFSLKRKEVKIEVEFDSDSDESTTPE